MLSRKWNSVPFLLYVTRTKHNVQLFKRSHNNSRNISVCPLFYRTLSHDKTNKMVCVLSEGSGQPGHSPSLIRVFAVRSVGSQGPKVSLCGQRRLIRLGGRPGWSESLLGAHAILLVLSCGGSCVVILECSVQISLVPQFSMVIVSVTSNSIYT